MKVQPLRYYNTPRPVFKNNPKSVKPTEPYSIYTGPETSKNQLIKDMEKNTKYKDAVEGYLKNLGISLKEFFSPEVMKEAKNIQSNVDSFYSRLWLY